MAAVILGWALYQLGHHESAIEKMRQGLASLQATGAEVLVPHFMTLLAQALHEEQQTRQAIHILRQARVMAERNGEQYYLAEIHRVQGEALLLQTQTHTALPESNPVVPFGVDAQINVRKAESSLHQALEVARRQKARSLELRAAMSLARLQQDPLKREEARGLVEKIYGGFTEALHTTDLHEAKALITKRSGQAR